MEEITLDRKLQGFQLIAQEKFQAIVASIPGKKDLILEQSLIKPLEHICSASWLKLKGIQRIFKFDAESAIPHTCEVQVYIIRGDLHMFQRVMRHISEIIGQQAKGNDAGIVNFHIVCVPNCFCYFQCLLEGEGLYGLVQLHRFNWDFIYLDQGVLSMEVPNVFSSLFLDEDTSYLPSVAQSLRVMQMICGRPELIVTFGDHSANIVKMLNTLDDDSSKKDSDFATMFIIDRDKDYASCLLSPIIYAGMILEVFNYKTGEVSIEADSNKILRQKLRIFLPSKYKEQQVNKELVAKTPSIRLNSLNDEIYGENRYKHFVQASTLVRAQAKAIGLEVQKLSDMKLDEMHDYVARKLPKITELKAKVTNHLNAIEKIIEMLGANYRKVQSLEEDILNNVSRKRVLQQIDELLTTDGQRYNTLRLMCLLHLCAGVTSEELVQFMRNYCTYFGAQHLYAFQQLAKASLLPVILEDEKSSKPTKLLSNLPIPKFNQTEFQANANRLKLLVSASDTDTAAGGSQGAPSAAKTECPSYVFNNLYIPVVAQVCSLLLKCTTAEDFSTKIGLMDKIQVHLAQSASTHTPLTVKSYSNHVKMGDLRDNFPLNSRSRNIFVYVVGGVTYAEIAACDMISRLNGANIVVASDRILTGADLISSAF